MRKITDTERERIQQNAPRRTYQEWAHILGLSYKQVYRAAKNHRDKYPNYRKKRLTPEQVRYIRINRHGESQRALGERFGVSDSVIYKVYHRLTYRHID